jgi:hypothetical protein
MPEWRIFSRQSILPDRTNHYDESGHTVGHSYQGLLGHDNHCNNHGHKVGLQFGKEYGKLLRFLILSPRHIANSAMCFHPV